MPDDQKVFTIAIPIYDGVDLLDISAPCEIFSWMTQVKDGRPVKVYLTTKTGDPITTRAGGQNNGVKITPHKKFAELKEDEVNLIFVPGGDQEGLVAAGLDDDYMKFIRSRGKHAEWITSVCEGALLLARSGLLNGFKATTHWAFYRCFPTMFPDVTLITHEPPDPRYPSFVVDHHHVTIGGKVVDQHRATGGGISSGLEECMELVEILAGSASAKKVRQNIQYYPTAVKQDLAYPPINCPFKSLSKWKPPVLPPDKPSGAE